MNLLTIHRDPDRYAWLAEHREDGPFFDEALGAWIVANPAHVSELLQNTTLLVVDYVRAYQSLERDGAARFPNIRFACSYLSLALNDGAHRIARRRLAELITESRNATQAAVPALVEEAFAPLLEEGEIDLMSDVLGPLVARVMAVAADLEEADSDVIAGVSTVFDRMLGPRKRARLEERIGELRQIVRDRKGAAGDEDDEGYRTALLILGSDAMRGTLGESLHRILLARPGRAFAEIDYPATPPEPGVSITERLVSEPFDFAGIRFEAGARLRFLFQSLAYSDEPSERARIFGIGARSCLGRALSLHVWCEVIRVLGRNPLRQQVLHVVPRTGDYAFTCPETLVLRIEQ